MDPLRVGGFGSKGTDIVPVGTVLDGKYRVLRTIGAGAMGAVFEAQHAGTGRRVALKVVAGELAREDLVARFQREARAAGGIDTQHITQVLDTGIDRALGLPYLVMELLVGEDLQQLLKRTGPIAPDLALRIIAQACLGLQKAHEAGVVHRDIKPANLFLARKDAGEVVVKLLDFGIAKVTMEQSEDAESASMTRTGSMLGSPLYMSPEQARGLKTVDHRADIWSLGVVLYQALAGRTPNHHVTALGELILAICSSQPTSVQEFAPWVSRDIASVVHWALRIEPNERFPSASAMFNALRTLLPYGWSLTQEMLVPLQDDMKVRVEPKLSASAPVPPFTQSAALGGYGLGVNTFGTWSAGGGGAGAGRTAVIDGGATVSALTHSQDGRPKTASRIGLAIGAVLSVAALGGGGAAYMVFKPQAAPADPGAVEVPAVPPKSSTEPIVAPERPIEAQSFRVNLVVLPADAMVEVDGTRLLPEEGVVELTGGLGSTKKVKLTKGAQSITAEVAITETGALPPKLELPVVSGRMPTKGTAATAPSGPAAPTVTAKPPPTTGIDHSFD